MKYLIQKPHLAGLMTLLLSVNAHSGPVMAAPMTTQALAHIKSYREWKHDIVMSAQTKISNYKAQIQARKARTTTTGTDPNIKNSHDLEAVSSRNMTIETLENQLHHEEYVLDVSSDLSISDYFVGYLTKVQNRKAAFKEVAGKLSLDEVTELMSAYANSVSEAPTTDFPASASNINKESVR